MSTQSSTAHLTPTSPQVTASVVKFRCLYTHDLRRKSKRWHDGYLRYHKFNKRVMVYDDQGNFIGDHHWRSNEEVQDGDEMELDKGVLIEVTENMGTTENDISTIYEKKMPSQGSPQTGNPMSQVTRVSTSTPASTPAPIRGSQSFRSLNDLLGIKKTPIGHLVSPYEQRNTPRPSSNAREPEREPKRQKISSMPNRSIEQGPPAQSQVIDLTDSNPGGTARQESNSLRHQTSRVGGGSAADVLSTNHQQRPAVQSKYTRPQKPDPPSYPRVPTPNSSEPDASLPAPVALFRANTGAGQSARPASNEPKAVPPPEKPPRPHAIPSKSRLSNMAPERDIARTQRTSPADRPLINSESRPKDGASPPLGNRRSDPSTVSRTSLSAAPEQPDRQPMPQVSVRMATNSAHPIQPEDTEAPTGVPSSLHASSSSNMPPPTRSPPSISAPPPTSMPPPSRLSALRPAGPTAALRMGAGKPRKKLMYSALLPGSSRTPSPTASDTPSSNANRQRVTEPSEQQPVVAPGDSSTANEEFIPSTSTQSAINAMIDGSGVKSPATIRNLAVKRSLNSSLRKSISDPTALTPREAREGRPAMENEPREQGPWTSEALDLFAFWPAGRPKPTE
ncbi:hypothetical protein N7535_002916 [Penicillium sp. DV-2018c]|nr:hypothetical protein N7461_001398 [Penicillium sp. DV-2018c]KAJ5575990.1 hypothetical protein N7535_002916 [Penicillium sp. DV-2018c]